MIDGVSSLQTNVIATVRRDAQRDVAPQSQQQTRQPAIPYVTADALPSPRRIGTSGKDPLLDQVAELMQVAQNAAKTAAGVEPAPVASTYFGKATAAYAQMEAYTANRAPDLLSLAV